MPPYPPFRPLHPPHPSFLPTRLQWYKFASNPLTSDAFESVTVQQLLDIHVTAASANRVEMSFTQIPFAEGKWIEIIFKDKWSKLVEYFQFQLKYCFY